MTNLLSLLILLLLLSGSSQNQINQSNNKPLTDFQLQNQQNINQQNINQEEGDFETAAESRYYIRVILEGVEEERATNTPELRLDGRYYCEDGTSGELYGRNIRSYGVTSFGIDCENPYVELFINHWLSRYVRLTSKNRNNPQDVFFKGGDVDRNNLIDDSDLLGILFNFNTNNTSTANNLYDVNLDGRVGDEDLNIVNRNFGNRGERGE